MIRFDPSPSAAKLYSAAKIRALIAEQKAAEQKPSAEYAKPGTIDLNEGFWGQS